MNLEINNKHIFAFSDTHGTHRLLRVPAADIIICAGDVVEDDMRGGEYDDFISWFAALPAQWKIFVPGNHELSFELDKADVIEQTMCDCGIIVLRNSVIDCDGVMIGSIDGNVNIARVDIPCDLDIFVTHCPPYGVLDDDMGSGEILNFLLHSQPKYHLFGHIHSTTGKEYVFGNTHCVNVGCVDRQERKGINK